MSELQNFKYDDYEVRIALHKNEPWWVLKDVCVVLELPSVHQIIEHIEDDNLTYANVWSDGTEKRKHYFVNESGLYEVLAQADKSIAKPFKHWIVNEMLPKFHDQIENAKSKQQVAKNQKDFSVRIFENEQFGQIRIVDQNGDPWFVAKDVARILGYVDTAQAVRDYCKGAVKITTPTKGGKQEVKIIPESDFYRLVLRSKKPEAEKFQDWVCGEVLPSIRKTGSYSVPALSGDALILAAMKELQHRLAEQTRKLEAAEKKIEEDKPKVDYFEDLIDRQNNLNFRDTAKELGVPEKKFIDWLIDKNFVYRDGKKQLKPYSESIGAGLFVLKEWVHGDMTGVQTLITVSGRDKFYRLLKPKSNTMTSKLDKLK